MALGPQQRPLFPRMSSSQADAREVPAPQQVVARFAELRNVHQAFAWFRSNARRFEDWQLEVTAIPAPPWGEAKRSAWLREKFQQLGLVEVQQDELGNVFGIHSGGRPDAPQIAVSAHLDTVFPAG